jgi:hypothetical protein
VEERPWTSFSQSKYSYTIRFYFPQHLPHISSVPLSFDAHFNVVWLFRYNRARPSGLRCPGLHHFQGVETRIPDHIGLSLTQTDIDRTTGVEMHFGKSTNLKKSRWGDHLKGRPPPLSQPASIERVSLYGCFSKNDIDCITGHVYVLSSLSLYHWPATGNPKWTELESLERLTVKFSEIGRSMPGKL